MYDMTVFKTFSLAGKTYSHQETISEEGIEGVEDTIPVAWAGSLTTRTDANTGTITLDDADHLITTSSVVDIYWDGGSRRGVNVGTVSTTSVPFDVGLGDDLPIADTDVQVCLVQAYSRDFDGDDVSSLVASADSTKATIVLKGTLTDDTALAFGTSSPAAALTLPANAIVTQVDVEVHTVFDGSAPTLSVGISGTVEKYMAAAANDLTTLGTYTVNPSILAKETTDAIILTYVADSSTVGAATVTIHYRVEHLAITIPVNGAYDWLSTTSVTNPIATDDIDQILMSIADTTTAQNVRVAVQLNI